MFAEKILVGSKKNTIVCLAEVEIFDIYGNIVEFEKPCVEF